MKKICLVIVLFIVQFISAQEQKNDSIVTPEIVIDENTIFPLDKVDVIPSPPQGEELFYNFINENMKQPDVPSLIGKVYLSFVVEKDGSLTDVRILRDIGFGTGEEAIRVVEKSPRWRPGKIKGKPVRVSYTLAIPISTH